MPPFTRIAWPVIFVPPGPARNTAIAARSSGCRDPGWGSFAASRLLEQHLAETLGQNTLSGCGALYVSALTRTPSRLASMASVRLNITIAAITPPMIDSPGVATFAASEAILMIRPDFCARRDGSTALHISSGAISCCVTMFGMSSSGMAWKSSGLNSPMHLRGLLAGYKVPKEIVLEETLPMTANGKVQKATLRQRFWGDNGRAIR
jgi:hypothetical protein